MGWYGQVMTENNKQVSIKCTIYIERNFFYLEDVDIILELEYRDQEIFENPESL